MKLERTSAPNLYQKMDDLLQEVKTLFEQQLNVESLLSLSKDLQVELKQHFISSPQSMLPSFNYTLPTGDEEGMYLGIEVGGSNLWMALAHLQGRSRGVEPLRIGKPMVFPIDNEVKRLKEYAFFDWMVGNIKEMLTEAGMDPERINGPLRMGVAWSFPIESVPSCLHEQPCQPN